MTWAAGIAEFLLAGAGRGRCVADGAAAPAAHTSGGGLLQNTLSLLIPFAVYAAAPRVHASGVLGVVVVTLPERGLRSPVTRTGPGGGHTDGSGVPVITAVTRVPGAKPPSSARAASAKSSLAT